MTIAVKRFLLPKSRGEKMKDFDKRAWEKYIKSRKLTQHELKNNALCEELKNTLDFALFKINLSLCNLWGEILNCFNIKRNQK